MSETKTYLYNGDFNIFYEEEEYGDGPRRLFFIETSDALTVDASQIEELMDEVESAFKQIRKDLKKKRRGK